MTRKCGEYMCEEDAVTMEEFDEDTEEHPCVGHADGSCVFCKTSATIEQTQTPFFHKSPGAAIFNAQLNATQEAELWRGLLKQCNIEKRTFGPEEIVFIPPDLKQAKTDYDELYRYMEGHNLESSLPYLMAMHRIIAMSPGIEQRVAEIQSKEKNIAYYDDELRKRMANILRKGKWPCTLVHEPRVLPFVLSMILEKLNKNKKHDMRTFLRSIKVSAEACAEALFQKIADAMKKRELARKKSTEKARAHGARATASGMAARIAEAVSNTTTKNQAQALRQTKRLSGRLNVMAKALRGRRMKTKGPNKGEKVLRNSPGPGTCRPEI
jgi:hypothetical protein